MVMGQGWKNSTSICFLNLRPITAAGMRGGGAGALKSVCLAVSGVSAKEVRAESGVRRNAKMRRAAARVPRTASLRVGRVPGLCAKAHGRLRKACAGRGTREVELL